MLLRVEAKQQGLNHAFYDCRVPSSPVFFFFQNT